MSEKLKLQPWYEKWLEARRKQNKEEYEKPSLKGVYGKSKTKNSEGVSEVSPTFRRWNER